MMPAEKRAPITIHSITPLRENQRLFFHGA